MLGLTLVLGFYVVFFCPVVRFGFGFGFGYGFGVGFGFGFGYEFGSARLGPFVFGL